MQISPPVCDNPSAPVQRHLAARGMERNLAETLLFLIFFALATIGYPLAGALTTLFAPDTQTISYAYRGLVLALSVLVFVNAAFRGRLQPIPLSLLLFFLAGSLRLFYDNYFTYITDSDKVAQYFFGTVMIPALAVAAACKSYSAKYFPLVIWVLSATIVMTIGFIEAFDLAGAADLSKNVGRLFFQSLNPTLIAYSSYFAIISGVILWTRVPLTMRIIFTFVAVVAVYLMLITAARGAWLTLILGGAVVAWSKKNISLVVFLSLAALAIVLVFPDVTVTLLERFSNVGVDRSSDERLFALQSSWATALENPIYGIAYVDPIALFYPHNLIVESGVAMGVCGMGMMVYIQIRLLLIGRALAETGDVMLAVFVITVLSEAFLSGSIWQSADFWAVAALTFGLPRQAALQGRRRSG